MIWVALLRIEQHVRASLRRAFWRQDDNVSFTLIWSCHVAQPGKCLYTTIRELVENSVDSAESISQLPDIAVSM